MTDSARQLRRGTDVFAADGVYLGTVVWVRTTALPDEDGESGRPAAVRADSGDAARFTGETLGPMPTADVGNGGPRRQNEQTGFASQSIASALDASSVASELVVLRLLVALNWGDFGPRLRRIPVSLVQVASLERIVLSVPAAALD